MKTYVGDMAYRRSAGEPLKKLENSIEVRAESEVEAKYKAEQWCQKIGFMFLGFKR